MKHKKGLIVFTALFTVVVFFAIFLMIWFWGDSYDDFNDSTFREEVDIPGLKEGACPQGLAMVSHTYYNGKGEIEYVTDGDGKLTEQPKTQDYYLVSAYFKDKPSRIYVTGKQSGYLGYITVSYGGKEFYGHVGGVATNGTVIWLGSEGKVYVAKRSNTDYTNVVDEIIKKCINKETFEFTKDFDINGNASFVSYYKAADSSTERLYVGEFYRKGNYETDKSHHITLPDGTIHRAFMYEYNVSSSTDYGLSTISDNGNVSNIVPKVQKIFSIPERIQGVARVSGNSNERGDTLILSQSYGLVNSEIMLYDFSSIENSANRVSFSSLNEKGFGFEYPGVTTNFGNPYRDSSVYVYYVYGNRNSKTTDSKGNKIYPSFYRSYSIPSMSEGLAVSASGRVNILFESASSKYKIFVRQPIDKIYSFMPSKR